MKFGFQLPYTPGPTGNHWDTTKAISLALEQAGFDLLTTYDHFMFETKKPDSEEMEQSPDLECFVTLGAIAAVTKRITLGQLVLGIPYRNPALVAKMASSLDLMAHGRTFLGIGAGWHDREFEGYGWDFGTLKERMERLEEATQVILKMWTERPASFQGKYYRLDRALNDPPTVSRPHPPIMIGGDGEKVTLRLVAQYAQWCNVFGDPATVRHKFEVLRAHCDRLGRDYDAITRSNHTTVVIAPTEAAYKAKRERLKLGDPEPGDPVGTPDQVIEKLAAFAPVGSQCVTLSMPDGDDLEAIHLFGETVIPALANA